MKFKLGMRTIKTGMGIYLALLICNLLKLESGTLAAITVVIGMQPSLMGSIKNIKNQILATTIGCIVAVVISYYFYGNIIMLAVAAVIAIWACVRLGWQDTITLVVITILLVGDAPEGDFLSVVQYRITMIFIGLSVAFLLNLIIPPRHTSRLIKKLDELRLTFEDFYHKAIDDLLHKDYLAREDVKTYTQKIKDLLFEARSIYVLSIESMLGYDENKEKDEYFLIRKAINAIQSNLERLLEIHHSIVLAPTDENHLEIRQMIHQYLTLIFNYHQKIYDHILYGKYLENRIINEFSNEEKMLEDKLLKLIKEASNLDPLHYYNMVAEGERIMNKAWSLIEDKERFDIKVQKENS